MLYTHSRKIIEYQQYNIIYSSCPINTNVFIFGLIVCKEALLLNIFLESLGYKKIADANKIIEVSIGLRVKN